VRAREEIRIVGNLWGGIMISSAETFERRCD
jgi:hypothetical protein